MAKWDWAYLALRGTASMSAGAGREAEVPVAGDRGCRRGTAIAALRSTAARWDATTSGEGARALAARRDGERGCRREREP